MSIRVLVVEDHPVFRDGLVAALGRVDDVEVVGAVGSVAAAHAALADADADVLLLDLGLPDGSGLDVLAAIRPRRPRLPVLVLTMSADGGAVLEAVRAGARGYLLKGSGQDEIVAAVRTVAAGGVMLDAKAGDVVLLAATGATQQPADLLGLTAREADVLRLVAAGLANPIIAERLGLSPKTVRNQVSMVLAKLGVESRAEAAARARAAGLA